jgi:DNA-binding NarL/FixJ family response regulator
LKNERDEMTKLLVGSMAVLVVAPEYTLRDAVRGIVLPLAPVKFIAVRTPEAAFEQVEHTAFDCIIVHLSDPSDKDGLIEGIRARREAASCAARIITIVRDPTPPAVNALLAKGVDFVLAEPINRKVLTRALTRAGLMGPRRT